MCCTCCETQTTDGRALPGRTFGELEARDLGLGAREYQGTLWEKVRCESNLEGYNNHDASIYKRELY